MELNCASDLTPRPKQYSAFRQNSQYLVHSVRTHTVENLLQVCNILQLLEKSNTNDAVADVMLSVQDFTAKLK